MQHDVRVGHGERPAAAVAGGPGAGAGGIRALVTDPALVAQWLGPNGYEIRISSLVSDVYKSGNTEIFYSAAPKYGVKATDAGPNGEPSGWHTVPTSGSSPVSRYRVT